jgi:GGDEF domain-containing protein
VAVFLVLRLEQIAGRFGAAAVDEVMQHVAAALASDFSPPDRLFRWHGPAFVAILRRTEPAHAVQHEIRRLIHYRFVHELYELNLHSRVAMIAINCAWATFPLEPSVTALKIKIEQFLASQPGSTFM